MQINALFSAYIFNQLGFQTAKNTNIPTTLKKINPCGGTAFRDSLVEGSRLIMKLYQILQKLGTGNTWNLVHVILTDGNDQNSKTNLNEALAIMTIIGKLVKVSVGVSQQAQNELKSLAAAGGQNSQYFRIGDNGIQNLFQKISINLGLQTQHQLMSISNQNQAALIMQKIQKPVIQLKKQNYAILFNLDVSGSMQGSKWNNVCQSVTNFTQFLGDGDLIGAMVFNDQARLLNNLPANDNLLKPKVVQRPASVGKGNNVVITKSTTNPQQCIIQ